MQLIPHVQELQQALEEFIRLCPESTSRYFPYLYTFLRRNIQRFYTMMIPFDREDVSDRLVYDQDDRARTFYTMIGFHVPLLFTESTGIAYTADQQRQLDRMKHALDLISESLDEIIKVSRSYYSFPSETGPADELLSQICEIDLRDRIRGSRIIASVAPNLPLIAHYPHYTCYLIVWIIERFRGSRWNIRNPVDRLISIKVCAEPMGVAISITFSPFHMTSEAWQSLLDRPMYSDNSLEHLYEQDGSLLPFISDDGDEQGAILRLPWAASQEEKA